MSEAILIFFMFYSFRHYSIINVIKLKFLNEYFKMLRKFLFFFVLSLSLNCSNLPNSPIVNEKYLENQSTSFYIDSDPYVSQDDN